MPHTVLLFVLYTLGSVSGLIILKTAMGQPLSVAMLLAEPRSLGALVLGATLYIGGFALWLIILSRTELSVAYPIAVGLTLVFSSAASVFFFGEQLNAARLAGIVLIFIGIGLVTRTA